MRKAAAMHLRAIKELHSVTPRFFPVLTLYCLFGAITPYVTVFFSARILTELATLRRYDLPVKIVLLDNQALGMVRQWQELFFDKRYSEIDLSDNPDFAEVARAFGMQALYVDKAADVDAALQALLDAPGPALLHVAIDTAANVWPLVPPNHNNAQMLDPDDAASLDIDVPAATSPQPAIARTGTPNALSA